MSPRERIHVRIGRGVEADQIVHWARKQDAHLIVMGTHGWGSGSSAGCWAPSPSTCPRRRRVRS